MSNSKSKKELRSLQDLMTKMDNLTKGELAADCQGEADDLVIPFSHTIIIPAGYTVGDPTTGETENRLTYNIECLHCKLEPCDITCSDCCRSMPSGLKGFQVSIVGCIPFNISVHPVSLGCGGLFDETGACNGDTLSSISYRDSICVNKNLCCIYAGVDEWVWPTDFECPLDAFGNTPLVRAEDPHNPLEATLVVTITPLPDGSTQVLMEADFTIPSVPPEPSLEA